jgi:glycosyltransferase involved in cell wall biosynthesis
MAAWNAPLPCLPQRGHNVTVFASGDSQTPVPLFATVRRALRYADSSIDPTTATLVHLPELYDRASEFDVIHNHVGPLAFPFMRSSPVPTLTTVYGGLDRVEVRRAFEVFAEQPLVATSWAQRAVLSGSDWRATIHGAVDLRQFHFRADPGEYLVYVGRVGPEKRLEWAIDLAHEVDRRLVIAGWVAPEDQAYFDDVLAPRLRRAAHVEDLAEIEEWERTHFWEARTHSSIRRMTTEPRACRCPRQWPPAPLLWLLMATRQANWSATA